MATGPACEAMLARVRVVRELGARSPGTYLARHEDARDGAGVVLETYAGLDEATLARVERAARALRDAPPHPHVVKVVSVERIGDGLSVVTDLVDGVPLAEPFFAMSLGARLRAVVDVLAGLSALHTSGVVHRGVLVASAFVGRTGRTQLGFAYRGALCARRDSYAPEALLGDEAAVDARSDVYGAGVLLWEAVAGRALFGDAPPETVLAKQLGGRVEKALPARSERWAHTLLPVIERALSVDPSGRYPSIAEMAAALRIAVRARLMMHDDVVEELWPAATTPKVTSGVVPAAEPLVVDARAQVDPEPTAASAEPLVEDLAPVMAPDPEPVPEATAPARPARRQNIGPLLAVACAVLASAAAVAVLVRARAPHAVAARADHAVASVAPPPVAEPAVATRAAPRATAQPHEKAAPKPGPTTKGPASRAGAKHGRHAEYDPSSI